MLHCLRVRLEVLVEAGDRSIVPIEEFFELPIELLDVWVSVTRC